MLCNHRNPVTVCFEKLQRRSSRINSIIKGVVQMLPLPTNERQRAWESSSRAMQDPSSPRRIEVPSGGKLLTNSAYLGVIRSSEYEGLHAMSPQSCRTYNQWQSSASDVVPGLATT